MPESRPGQMTWKLLQMDEAPLQSVDGCLGAVAGAHFVEQRTDVDADSFFRDAEFLGNLAIAAAAGNADENLGFTRGELDGLGAFSQPVKGIRAEVAQAAVHALDSVQ